MQALNWILATLGGVGVIVSAVCIGGAVLFRDTLTAWLTKRVAKGLERDAERYKHELSRDMEKYKDELNRAQSVERLRAEMRKVVAEKMLAIRLDAYHEIYSVLRGSAHDFLAYLELPPQARCSYDEVVELLAHMGDVLRRNALHLGDRFEMSYLKLLRNMQAEADDEAEWTNGPPRSCEEGDLKLIQLHLVALLTQVAKMHERLPDVLADSIAKQPDDTAEA